MVYPKVWIGVIFMAVGVIIGAVMATPTANALKDAAAITGASNFTTIVPIGMLVAAVALTIGPAAIGVVLMFQGLRGK